MASLSSHGGGVGKPSDEAEGGGGVAKPSDESEFCAWVTMRLISGAARTLHFKKDMLVDDWQQHAIEEDLLQNYEPCPAYSLIDEHGKTMEDYTEENGLLSMDEAGVRQGQVWTLVLCSPTKKVAPRRNLPQEE